MTTAALGGSVQVPTIDGGRAKVTIPSGTQSARQFRLRGKGMTGLHGRGRGDMYIEIVVETPVNLTKQQQELLKEFEQGGGTGAKATSPQAEGFFSKVKELWEDLTE
jgi:molecular chaperone DnaJ